MPAPPSSAPAEPGCRDVGEAQMRRSRPRRVVHVAEGEGHIDHVVIGDHVVVAADRIPFARLRMRKRGELAQLADGPLDALARQDELSSPICLAAPTA